MAQESINDARILRLAFVNGWSDEFLAIACEHLQGAPDEVLGALQRAADDLDLSVLRGGDETLAQRAAATLGFASFEEMRHFQRENPLLSAALKAEPALAGGEGRVVGVSSTEIVFATEHGLLFFDRALLKTDVGVGDAIQVGKIGAAELTARALAPVYEPGKTYNGPIPEIKYLPVTAIHRQEMDFRPEVMTVSDEVAQNMDFSEPVEVTAYRYGPVSHDTLPEVTLRDGHHRTAAAIQTGRPHLPVQVTAINAKGEKLNALIAMSQLIEISMEKNVMGKPEQGNSGFTHRVFCRAEAVSDLCALASRVGSYDPSRNAIDVVLDEQALDALRQLNIGELYVIERGADGKFGTDELCYYSEQQNAIIDTVDALGLTRWFRRTAEEVTRDNPDAVLMRSSEAMRAYEAVKESQTDRTVREVTCERYREMLNILPPMAWTRSLDTESFKISEALWGNVRAIFARVGDRYFTFQEHGTIDHATIVGKIMDAINNQTVVPVGRVAAPEESTPSIA